MINDIEHILNEIKVSKCIYLYVTYISEEKGARENESKRKKRKKSKSNPSTDSR
jgi:hypothetical protein